MRFIWDAVLRSRGGRMGKIRQSREGCQYKVLQWTGNHHTWGLIPWAHFMPQNCPYSGKGSWGIYPPVSIYYCLRTALRKSLGTSVTLCRQGMHILLSRGGPQAKRPRCLQEAGIGRAYMGAGSMQGMWAGHQHIYYTHGLWRKEGGRLASRVWVWRTEQRVTLFTEMEKKQIGEKQVWGSRN